METRSTGWRGRPVGGVVGLVGGTAVVGAAQTAPGYVSTPSVGIGFGAAVAVAGFGLGLGVDQWRVRRDQNRQWRKLFADAPGADLAGQPDADSVLARLAPQSSPVPFDQHRLREITPIRHWCTDDQPGRVWRLVRGLGSGKPAWRCGWVYPQGYRPSCGGLCGHRPPLLPRKVGQSPSALSFARIRRFRGRPRLGCGRTGRRSVGPRRFSGAARPSCTGWSCAGQSAPSVL